MGPEFWKPDKSTKLKKCSEFTSDACDPEPTDRCCAVIPCVYCLDWAGSYPDSGTANWTGSSWSGIVNTWVAVLYWERNSETGVCEFIVVLDGVEIYRADCYGGQSCRDSSGSAEAEIDGQAGTLTWTKLEPRPLEYIPAPDNPECKTWMCGSCECSCDCLCVTITDLYDHQCTDEICDIAYPCDAPVWFGSMTCGGVDYDLSIALGRDAYGNCIITPTVNGEEQADVSVSGCGDMSATFTLANGTRIDVRCKRCSCQSDAELCCPDRDCPGDGGPNPFPTTLTLTIEDPDSYGCWDMTGILTLGSCPEINYSGTAEATCTWCGHEYNIKISVVLACSASGGWLLRFVAPVPDLGDCSDVTPTEILLTQFSCDPILLQKEDVCLTCGSLICEGDPGEIPLPYPHPPFCGLIVSVFET